MVSQGIRRCRSNILFSLSSCRKCPGGYRVWQTRVPTSTVYNIGSISASSVSRPSGGHREVLDVVSNLLLGISSKKSKIQSLHDATHHLAFSLVLTSTLAWCPSFPHPGLATINWPTTTCQFCPQLPRRLASLLFFVFLRVLGRFTRTPCQTIHKAGTCRT